MNHGAEELTPWGLGDQRAEGLPAGFQPEMLKEFRQPPEGILGEIEGASDGLLGEGLGFAGGLVGESFAESFAVNVFTSLKRYASEFNILGSFLGGLVELGLVFADEEVGAGWDGFGFLNGFDGAIED